MMKSIAMSLCLVATTSFAATTTSSTQVDISKKSFKDRLTGYYFGEIASDTLSTEEGDAADNAFANYFNIGYKISNDTKISTTTIFKIVDSNDENGKGDRFVESDQRVALGSTIFKKDKTTLKAGLRMDLPTSRGSQDKDKIIRIRPNASVGYKFDDYNNIEYWTGFYKDIYQQAESSVDETSRHFLLNEITYYNTYLSENYAFKLVYDGYLEHVPGTADNNIRKDDTTEAIYVGIETEVAGMTLNPYLAHNPSAMRATNKLGGGISLFKSF